MATNPRPAKPDTIRVELTRTEALADTGVREIEVQNLFQNPAATDTAIRKLGDAIG